MAHESYRSCKIAGHKVSGQDADVRAIAVQPDAPLHHFHFLILRAGGRTMFAFLSALQARFRYMTALDEQLFYFPGAPANLARNCRGVTISIPNGFCRTNRSSSRETTIFAPAAKAQARCGSSFASRLRCLPNGDGSTRFTWSRYHRPPALV